MNKKFFTQLMGVFLLLLIAFTAKGQGSKLIDEQPLLLGDTLSKLDIGANDQYHLQVTGIIKWDGTKFDTVNRASHSAKDTVLVLYMGQQNRKKNRLFIDSLNFAPTNLHFKNNLVGKEFVSDTRSERSAASLWCTVVQKYLEGQNITFDFINKKQTSQLLEIDIDGYENWPVIGGLKTTPLGDSVCTPGHVAQWQFSQTYSTTVQNSRFLISYITTDTVAVLAVRDPNPDTSVGNPTYELVVKICAASKLPEVEGAVLFTLRKAAPFTISVKDFNSMFGKFKPDQGKLSFSPKINAKTELGNVFLPALKALDIEGVAATTSVLNYVDSIGRVKNSSEYEPHVGMSYDELGERGYINLMSGKKYITVDTAYFEGNLGGTKYLSLSDTFPKITDEKFVGQQAFRLLYFPSGDSIYINSYQATYLPTYDPSLITETTKHWADDEVLRFYTYRAHNRHLDTKTFAVNPLALTNFDIMRAPLKPGYYAQNKVHEPYSFHHKLLVTRQDIGGGKVIVTLGEGNHKYRSIPVRMYFEQYEVCKAATGERPYLDPDLYLIRNEKGEYLHVPLYSANDSAVWVTLEKDVHPELLPSFQWVVERMNANSKMSSLRITNREFPHLTFDRVRAEKENVLVPFLEANKVTKGKKINFLSEPFDYNKHSKKIANANSYKGFLSLSGKSKTDPYLGYTWINPDSSLTKVFAFNYRHGIDAKKFLGWNGKFDTQAEITDSLIYANYGTTFDKMYFRLDTLNDEQAQLVHYGYKVRKTLNQIPGLVDLKRIPYRIAYEDPLKLMCNRSLSIVPAEQGRYALGKRGNMPGILGKPLFFLRHVYHADGKNFFALVQTIDTAAVAGEHLPKLNEYLKIEFGQQLANLVTGKLATAPAVNPGLFIASVDDQMATLKMTLRADAQTRVSTFAMEEDLDPIYRRFNDADDKEFERKEFNDAPRVLKFHTVNNKNQFLFENTGAINAAGDKQVNYYNPGKRHYLGLTSIVQNPNTKTDIFVDTAYINRPGGDVKPQYLLMVRPNHVPDTMACDEDGVANIPVPGYIRGYYLINAFDSAHYKSGADPDEKYRWKETWERFIFVDAIHANDTLYILEGVDVDALKLTAKLEKGGSVIDVNKLKTVPSRAKNAPAGKGIHKIGLGDNYHKDAVFQFRFIERKSLDFIIESETTDRGKFPVIKPCEGGWLKIHNGVPAITRSDESAINYQAQADIFNVKRLIEDEVANPVANDEVSTSAVTVVAGNDAVIILNAAGKEVVINNVLGQTIARTVLSSDNASIAAPKGVVIVTVEGETAQKTLVK